MLTNVVGNRRYVVVFATNSWLKNNTQKYINLIEKLSIHFNIRIISEKLLGAVKQYPRITAFQVRCNVKESFGKEIHEDRARKILKKIRLS